MTTYNGTNGADTFVVSGSGDTYNGDGGADIFDISTPWAYYNSFYDTGAASLIAGINNAYIGLAGNFSASNGIATINTMGLSGIDLSGTGAFIDLAGIDVIGQLTILANHNNQALTGAAGANLFAVSAAGDTLTGGGGADIFAIDTPWSYYNTYQDTGAGIIEAGQNGAFIGLQGSYGSANGIGTISANGYAGVQLASNGATLDLSGTKLIGPLTIVANQNNQSIIGTSGADDFAVSAASMTLNGHGGADIFTIDTPWAYYNNYTDTGAAIIAAGQNGAFIGLQGSYGAGNGIGTISAAGYSGVQLAGNGSTLDLSTTTLIGPLTILANQNNQTIIGSSGPDAFAVSAAGMTLKGGGGADVFTLDTPWSYYNTYSDTGAGILQAGMNGAFIGMQGSFSAASGIGTISANGYAGVQVAGNGATLDLSSVKVIGPVTILANQNNQSITGTSGVDDFAVSAAGMTLNGGGGADVFTLDTPWSYYNTYSDTGAGILQAGMNGAFIGMQGSFSAASGIGTISANGYAGVQVAGNGATLDLSAETVIGTVTVIANQNNQSITGTSGVDNFAVSAAGMTLNGGGGADVFTVDTPWSYYNSYSDTGAGVIDAGQNNAFIGLSGHYDSTNGIGTISANGFSGVQIASNGAVLNLAGTDVIGPVTILANQNNQAITGATGANMFAVSGAGNSLTGGGGADVFTIDTPWSYYNTYQDTGAGSIDAGQNGAYIGLAGNFTAANGIGTISANGYANVVISDSASTLDLSGTFIQGPLTVLANHSGQTVKASSNGHDSIQISSSGVELYSSAAGHDVFQLVNGFGSDTINNFIITGSAPGGGNAAHDVVDLSNLAGAPTTWAGIQALLSTSSVGAVLTIGGNKLVFAGIAKSQLSATDFNVPAPIVVQASGTPGASNVQAATLGTAAPGAGSDALSVKLDSDADFATGSSVSLVNGTLIYTPGAITAANAGTDSITYTVTDAVTGAAVLEQQNVALSYHAFTAGLSVDTGSSATDGITSNPALSGLADPNATITINNGATQLASVQASPSGAWSFADSGLADGAHTLTVSEAYIGGGSASVAVNFTLETTPPTLAITAPASVAATSPLGAVVNFSAVTSDVVDGASDPVSYTEAGNPVTSGAVFAVGTHVIQGVVTDRAGNSTIKDFSFTVTDPGPSAGNVSDTVRIGSTVDLTSLILGADSAGPVGGTLTITADNTASTLGTVQLSGGELTYTATGAGFAHIPANGTAQDIFGYTISDEYGVTASGTVTLTISNPATTINGALYGNATITGTPGADVITAYGWNNIIDDKGGSDVINAGQGQATVYVYDGDAQVTLSGYNNFVQGFDLAGAGAWTGADGNVTVTGSQGNSTVLLGNGNDQISLGGYSNTILVGDGNDTINGGTGNSTITVGNGNDGITVGGFGDVITGGNGNKTVSGPSGNARIDFHAGTGNDSITLSGNDNTVLLGTTIAGGTSTVVTGSGDATVTIAGGNNNVTAGGNNNHISIGGSGTNSINAIGGGAVLSTGSGTDSFMLGGWNNVLTLGGGSDQMTFLGGSDRVTLDLGTALGGNVQVSGLLATQGDVFDLTKALAEAGSNTWSLTDQGSNAVLEITDSHAVQHAAAVFVGVTDSQVLSHVTFLGPLPASVGV